MSENIQSTRSEDHGDAKLFLQVHLHLPYQWDGHDDQDNIGDDVAEPIDVLDIVGFRVAHRLRVHSNLEIPRSFDGSAREDGEEDGDKRP